MDVNFGEFSALYGTIGLGLIVTVLPVLLEIWKNISKWKDDAMYIVSVAAVYVLCWLLLIALFLKYVPEPEPYQYLILILALIIYPLPVWAGTQGVYVKFIRKTDQ